MNGCTLGEHHDHRRYVRFCNVVRADGTYGPTCVHVLVRGAKPVGAVEQVGEGL
jgi:hypothetical protein